MGRVDIKGVRKAYIKDNWVIKGCDLTIEDGEFCVLLGPSGCGKSTLLRMIAGLEEITEGEISIDGRVINDVKPKDRDISMVFQSYALYPHKTVYGNMAWPLQLRKMSPSEVDKTVREVAELMSLTDFLERLPKHLSGGQRQRVAVGRALVRKPKVYLFDEPLSNLDAKLRTSMRSELKILHERFKTTFVYVTHDQIEAMTMADKIVLFNGGIIQQMGKPKNFYKHPANSFVGSFIGNPPMNFIKLKKSNGAFMFGTYKIDHPDTQNLSELVVGMRPEKIFFGEKQGNSSLDAKIVIDELIGKEYLYFLNLGSNLELISPNFSVVSEDEIEYHMDDDIKLYFNKEEVKLFLPDGDGRCLNP